ncbi:hypothetical protein DL95DRAFT_193652 [Leptodontidium sp. 2 PMI_412]|nr:hypothetical protein DL95DRAFT_193652 [Leptodontidium sp. 2 PMI_412]
MPIYLPVSVCSFSLSLLHNPYCTPSTTHSKHLMPLPAPRLPKSGVCCHHLNLVRQMAALLPAACMHPYTYLKQILRLMNQLDGLFEIRKSNKKRCSVQSDRYFREPLSTRLIEMK